MFLMAALAAVLSAGACSSGDSEKSTKRSTTATTAPPISLDIPATRRLSAVVRLIDGIFIPNKITIQPGQSVTFINVDGGSFDVTADDAGGFTASDAKTFAKKGARHTVVFDSEGTFGYHSEQHPDGAEIGGTIEVKAESSPTGPSGSVPSGGAASGGEASGGEASGGEAETSAG